ncbi:hypothetical protein [Cellulomonas soli]|uniref:hypothetical protein n=1 Tax=Cellulomonas soli TaxID=931535 RepID=UPI0011BD87D8|nr:hypothetical protein [Cellulomonas soli]NYI59996.1 hypothetical protein [Cellulomonas soli]
MATPDQEARTRRTSLLFAVVSTGSLVGYGIAEGWSVVQTGVVAGVTGLTAFVANTAVARRQGR